MEQKTAVLVPMEDGFGAYVLNVSSDIQQHTVSPHCRPPQAAIWKRGEGKSGGMQQEEHLLLYKFALT